SHRRRTASRTLQPTVGQRDIEAEVANSVGGVISPLLANLFMHYAFDAWLVREFPNVAFERYCDDAVVHCASEDQAHLVREAIAARLAECGGLQLHPDKTRIVYCKDRARRGEFQHTSFTFLGYGFRSRMVRTRTGRFFSGFNPAISDEAAKGIRERVRSWRLHQRSGSTMNELAREVNTVVRGWMNYYGRFRRSALHFSLNRINDYLVRWLVQKYKRFRGRWKRAREALRKIAHAYPRLFTHWAIVTP
ncbi:hypothetical protein ABIA39_008698, partial [Nocardia sp. GAS34]|uniref:group II intron maturase-specific domain-containing protein n=1 Tax=unclassified Nocardia TaxID=2637762 RepID=UPI003D1FE925